MKDFTSSEKKWNVIVSHFHDDHVRGFRELFERDNSTKVFENAFLPAQYSYESEQDKNYYLRYIEANLHVFCFAKQSRHRDNARTFFTIPVIMNALANRVHYLSSSSRNDAFPVTIYCPTDSLALDDLANGYDIEKALEVYYGANTDKSGFAEDFRRTANEIYCIMEKYISNDAGTDIGSAKDDHRSIVDKIKKLSKKYSSLSKDVRMLQKVVKGSIDDRSLVFDVSFPSDTMIDVLFLGDNSDSSLRKLFSNFKKRHYDYIKADHHGSRGGKILKKLFDVRSPESKVATTVCCCGKGHRSGMVNPEYNDLSNKVLWTEKKDKWTDSFHNVFGQCRIMPNDL